MTAPSGWTGLSIDEGRHVNATMKFILSFEVKVTEREDAG